MKNRRDLFTLNVVGEVLGEFRVPQPLQGGRMCTNFGVNLESNCFFYRDFLVTQWGYLPYRRVPAVVGSGGIRTPKIWDKQLNGQVR